MKFTIDPQSFSSVMSRRTVYASAGARHISQRPHLVCTNITRYEIRISSMILMKTQRLSILVADAEQRLAVSSRRFGRQLCGWPSISTTARCSMHFWCSGSGEFTIDIGGISWPRLVDRLK